ncbi:MAG TPA: phosphoenolpyruvate--protein phosphotransferase [Thermodesulfobacteriota bacterium]|nr:phosphoenolpyruvate--protein phosphotransferase [Thermodesulfobacteriota bacterium]
MVKRRENITLKGIGASSGIAIGRAHLIERGRIEVEERSIKPGQVEREINRFKRAVEQSKGQLRRIKGKFIKESAKEHIYIIDAHLLILEDRMLIDDTIKNIREGLIGAEGALKRHMHDLSKIFDRIEDEYLRDRKSDIEQIGERVLRNLVGKRHEGLSHIKEKVVIVAHDLTPSDTAQMKKDKIIGFITDIGGRTSHTSIVARSLEIPAVVGLDNITQQIMPGDIVVLDGMTGVVIINPAKAVFKAYLERSQNYQYFEEELLRFRELPSVTKDGYSVRLAGNIELPEEIPSLKDHGAQGIGLYRTEFLYMGKRLPTEEDHFDVYRRLAEGVAPYSATIRTLDMGGDKMVSHIEWAEETNPAMGLRAIRFSLKDVELFKAQLSGILRASAYGKLKIMFPMISGMRELRQAKEILNEVKSELNSKGIPYDREIEVGIMMEIPSAAAIADILAKEADFFSIGTNDLIQYSLAIDRVNEHVAYLYEPLHPAIIRIIKGVVDAAHNAGIKVSMCGEMAGEPAYVPILLGLGLDELSMNAPVIPWVKKIVRGMSMIDAKKLLDDIMAFSAAAEIERCVRERMAELFPDEFIGGISQGKM